MFPHIIKVKFKEAKSHVKFDYHQFYSEQNLNAVVLPTELSLNVHFSARKLVRCS